MKELTTLIALLFSSSAWSGWSDWSGWDFFSSAGIKEDEQLVFFPSEAYHSDADGSWSINVHGWVYEPEALGEINTILRKALAIPVDNGIDNQSLLRQRLRWFMVDNERGKRITIKLGDNTYRLHKSAANGHFSTAIRVSEALLLSLLATSTNANPIHFDALLPNKDQRSFRGEILVIPKTGLSIISDIDDTIKISNVNDKKELIRNTFMRPFKAAPGMASLYRHWQQRQSTIFHYVSASPWQLYPELSAFMRAAGFPHGLFHMKYFRWKDSSFLNLFADPVKYKMEIIEAILQRYPQRRFILVGDSGEKDPEVYGIIARKYHAQIERILIRRVGDNNGAQRFGSAFSGLQPGLWQTFTEPVQ